MHHSAKTWVAKIEVMLKKAEELEVRERVLTLTEPTEEEDQINKYLREDIRALARDIANNGN